MRRRRLYPVVLAGLVAVLPVQAASAGKVAKPRFVRTIATGETGWFSSPGLVDLDGDRPLEIVAPFYSTFVFDAKGLPLGKGTASEGRVYAPGVVADLDGDGVREIVAGGNEGTVAAYDLAGGRRLHDIRLRNQAGNGNGIGVPAAPSIADIDRDGRLEIVVSTFDHGIDVYRVPRSRANRLPWPTGRGNLLRTGTMSPRR